MGTSTISMVMFNSYVSQYQRVSPVLSRGSFWGREASRNDAAQYFVSWPNDFIRGEGSGCAHGGCYKLVSPKLSVLLESSWKPDKNMDDMDPHRSSLGLGMSGWRFFRSALVPLQLELRWSTRALIQPWWLSCKGPAVAVPEVHISWVDGVLTPTWAAHGK